MAKTKERQRTINHEQCRNQARRRNRVHREQAQFVPCIVEVTRRELGDWFESITASPAPKDKDDRCLVSLNIKVADDNYMTPSRRTRLLEWLEGELESDFGECFLGPDNVYTAEDDEKFMIEFTIEDHGNL